LPLRAKAATIDLASVVDGHRDGRHATTAM
jgi:hypothetical protein